MKEISLHILDIVQNAITAKAALVEITVDEDAERDCLSVTVRDDGTGMDAETLARVSSPFVTSRKTRKVGLGIPLFKAGAEASGGRFAMESEKGVGTVVRAQYALSHIDRPPLGDMAATLTTAIAGNEDVDFLYRHRVGGAEFVFDTKEARGILGPVSLGSTGVVAWIREYLAEGINELNGGA